MACHSCATKFNFFHREQSCGNCGISFCSKCLKQKCKIESKGSAEFNVCKPCFSKLAAGPSSSAIMDVAPPDAYLKRLESLDNPCSAPITVYQQNQKFQKLKTGLSEADLQILERLEKLREDRKNKTALPSEAEIRSRLASLRGESPLVGDPTKNQFLPDMRSDEEKIDSLLDELLSEQSIDVAHKPHAEIEVRLAKLQDRGLSVNSTGVEEDTDNSEEEVEKITRKIIDEVSIDRSCSAATKFEEEMERSETPELPWCVICNKDACVRCIDCGGDLYCDECNVEFHQQTSDKGHRIIPYKAPQRNE